MLTLIIHSLFLYGDDAVLVLSSQNQEMGISFSIPRKDYDALKEQFDNLEVLHSVCQAALSARNLSQHRVANVIIEDIEDSIPSVKTNFVHNSRSFLPVKMGLIHGLMLASYFKVPIFAVTKVADRLQPLKNSRSKGGKRKKKDQLLPQFTEVDIEKWRKILESVKPSDFASPQE